jgi:DNA-binding IclR family transcriptional regulator
MIQSFHLMRESMAEDNSPVRAVTRAIDVLLSLEDGPQSLARIAATTTLTKPTVHRLLATLATRQLVIQDPASSDYMLGPGCLGIADAVLRGLGGLGLLAHSTLVHLAETSQETVALHVPAGTQRVCVEQIPSPQPVRYTSAVGVAKPMYTGAMGKVLLAFMQEDDRREVLDRLTLMPITSSTVTDRSVLESQLSEVRRKGYSISRGEQADGVAALSAPVFAANGHVAAALSILGPTSRMTDPVIAKLRQVVVDAANDVSATLGYQQPASRRAVAAVASDGSVAQ